MDNEVAYALNLLTQRVSALEGQVMELRQGAPATAPGQPTASGRDPEIETLLREGKLINAIKLYRERTNASLGEAKNAVEALQRELRL